MAVTRLGQFGVGLSAYGVFAPKSEASVVVVTLPEYREFGLVVPPETPGPAPRINDAKLMSDRDFWALARIAEINAYLEDVDDWAAAAGITDGEEIVDVFGNDGLEPDDELFGRSGRGRRKPG